MAIKPPSARTGVRPGEKPIPKPEEIERLVQELADRPYGGAAEPEAPKRKPKLRPITLSLPDTVIEQLEDKALENKRSGGKLKTVSRPLKKARALSALAN